MRLWAIGLDRLPVWLRAGERQGRFRRRLVLLTGGISALFALALILVVQIAVSGQSTNSVRLVERDRADAIISSIDVASRERMTFYVPATFLGANAAVFDSTGQLIAGGYSPRLASEFQDLAMVREPATVRANEDFSVYAQPFRSIDGSPATVVVAEPFAPYEHDEHSAVAVSVAAGVLMVLVTVFVAAWVSRRALAPVEAMARTAEQWSERDLAQRFDLGPPTDEIRALGHTLDSLLEKVAVAITAEQRLTSELAHELRSPLTAIQATSELMAMREDVDAELREDIADIHQAAQAMGATISVLLEIARRGSTGSAGEWCSASDVCEQLTQQFSDGDCLSCDVPDALNIAVPLDLAVRTLAPVIENGLKAASHVRVGARVVGRQVEFRVSDDGPGVAAEMANTLFEPGATTGGIGLGLPLARRVARSVGGDVRLRAAKGIRGAEFLVLLPWRH